MPLNMVERQSSSTRQAQHDQDVYNEEEFLEDIMDQDDEDEEEDQEKEDEDEEIEYQYQCDFKKRNPRNAPCQHTSLLSSLLSCTTASNQCSSPHHNTSSSKPISIAELNSNKTTEAEEADSLSESLKRNIEWEHSQSSLRKYEKIKGSTSSDSLTDNFSRW